MRKEELKKFAFDTGTKYKITVHAPTFEIAKQVLIDIKKDNKL